MGKDNQKKLLALDYGYSSLKTSFYDENGVLQFEKFISAAAKLGGKDLVEDPNDDTIFCLNGEYYVLGTPALKVPRSLLYRLETYEDMKATYPIWLSYLLKRYGGDNWLDRFDHVILGLSLAFSDKASDLLDHLYESLNITKDNFFLCLPQGLSCKLAYQQFGLDLREVSKKNDVKMRNYLIVDGGFLSIDAAQVLDGKSSAGAAIGLANTGVICIVYKIIDYLFQNFEMKMSVKEGQTVLDNNGLFTRRMREYDISDKVIEFTREYLINVIKLLEEKFSESLDSIEGILVCGGLAYFFNKMKDDEILNKEIEKHFPKSFIKLGGNGSDSEFYNSISYLKIAEKLIDEGRLN